MFYLKIYDMKKIFILIVTAVAIISIIFGLIISVVYSDANIACIYVNDKLYDSVDLKKVKNSYTIDIQVEDGGHNIILVEEGAISMQSADCPDKLCVNQGKISNGIYPIVCLPNKVIISVKKKSDINAVTK